MVIVRKARSLYEQGERSLYKRPFEWFFAAVTVGWGIALGDPSVNTFDGQSYVVFKRLADEGTWALFCFYGGLLRLLVLWVNGSWYRTGLLRTVASFSTLTLWFIATVALALAGNKSTGIYTYAVFFVVEFSCMLAAGYEAGRLESAQYHKLYEQVRQGKLSPWTAIMLGVVGLDRGTAKRDSPRT